VSVLQSRIRRCSEGRSLYLDAMTEHDSWDAAARARVGDRWVKAATGWNRAMTDALLATAALTPDSVVLDLAAGSGDPALTVAERVIHGKVVALDSSHTGLLLVKTRARQVAFDSKVSCIHADAHAIPLARDSVDRITCRCGIMFFDNTGLVMSEMLRVLKPGGRVVAVDFGATPGEGIGHLLCVLGLRTGWDHAGRLRDMFRDAGFDAAEMRPTGHRALAFVRGRKPPATHA